MITCPVCLEESEYMYTFEDEEMCEECLDHFEMKEQMKNEECRQAAEYEKQMDNEWGEPV